MSFTVVNAIIEFLRFLTVLESKLSPCEYKRTFLYGQHDGKVPNWLYIPKCEVNGSYSRQQCNEKSRRCWCVNENGDMTRWVGRNETSNICSKGLSVLCFLF